MSARPDKHDPDSLRTATRAVHVGNDIDRGSGAIRTPLVMANAYALPEDPSAIDWSGTDEMVYTRNSGVNQLGLELSISTRLAEVTPMPPRRTVILGAGGQVGAALARILPAAQALTRAEFDLADPQRVAGLVQPLSLVTVFATVPDPKKSGGDHEVTRVLLPEVQVLRVGQEVSAAQQQTGTAQGGITEEIPKQILTLAVDAAEAQKLIYAQKNGQLYLALKGPKTGTVEAAGTSAQTLFRVRP